MKDTYQSPQTRVPFYGKLLPSFFFYSKAFVTLIKASQMAKAGKYTGDEWTNSSLEMIKSMESVGVRIHVENLSSFQKLDAPCVFISNHMSTLETFVLPGIIQPYRNVTFVVKDTLVKYPVFKNIVLSRNPITVGRVNPRTDFKKVLSEGKDHLQNNTSIIIFPQTTRSTILDKSEFNSIGTKLAAYADVPIVPVALKTDAWKVGRWVKDVGKIDPTKTVHFCFGDPMTLSGNGKEDHQNVVDFISEKLAKMQT
jgi:1-acyl-sn-glycerol-3-phosphate acyltransferase